MPADPAQPNCAISGEQFESIWDDATNGWRYKGAVALDAQQAEQCAPFYATELDGLLIG